MAQQTAYELMAERNNLISKILSDNLHGKHIYLLGSAEFGPTNEPILIKSTVGLYNKFGKHGSLIDAFHALKYTSKDNQVYLVKTTGEHATAHLNVNIQNGEIVENGLTLVASQSNEAFNEVEITVDIDRIIFTFPDDILVNDVVYKYSDYHTIDKLCEAINKDTKLKRSYIYAYYTVDSATPVKHALFACNPTSIFMYGGQCGLNYSKNLLYNCLERTYEILESHNIDIVIPVDAFMDDIHPDDKDASEYQYNKKFYQPTKDYLTEDFTGRQLSFMNQLLQFCIKQLNSGLVTTGIIGFNPSWKYASDYLYESDELAAMYKACHEYNLKWCDNPFYSFLVSVVAGDIRYNQGTIIDNGYLAYAALCSKIIFTDGTTNIPISDTISLYHEFSEEVLKDLADTGIVTFRHSPLYETPVVYDGITASTEHENLKLYCNVRMIQMCMSYVNQLFQFYIGHNIVDLIEQRIVFDDLNTILNAIKSRGIITSYDYTLAPNYSKGEIKVYLNLMTCYMVKSVQICSVINVEFAEEE